MLDWLSKCLTLAREYEGLTDQYVQCKKCIAGLQKIQRKQDAYLKRKVDLWKISVACALYWLFVVGLGCFSCTPLFAGILFYYKSLPVWLKSGIVILTAVIIYKTSAQKNRHESSHTPLTNRRRRCIII